MKAILLFPGQGSQTVGMGRALYERHAYVRELFAEADEVLGFGLTRLCLEGPADQLTLTANAQPALLLVSTAYWFVLQREHGIQPVAAAGHSLGEFSALVAAGSLVFAEALRLVHERGRAMQAAVAPGRGAMAAIFGLDADALAALCRKHSQGSVVSPANFNGAGQIVIAGERQAVGRVVAAAKEVGAKRAVFLQVSAPFHCELMVPAAARLEEVLSETKICPTVFPVLSNVTAEPYPSDVSEMRQLLVRQVTAPVQWERCVRSLVEYSCGTAIEVGPGRVLTNLAKRMVAHWNCLSADDLDGLRGMP
ncbi:MAG: ACP S-malonyltransferase [Candidatus Binatia bacterium]|nr:ACP S-malonyltransferase [Candidatus Binatia bacterium]